MSFTSNALSATFQVPKLAKDGLHWITYKTRVTTAVGAKGLSRFLLGSARKPPVKNYKYDSAGVAKLDNGTVITEKQIDDYEAKVDKYAQKECPVTQQLYSTIHDETLIQIQDRSSAAAIWDTLTKMHEGKSEMMQVDIQ
ncbi:hypothetical protein SERLA73DRAFT_68459 [Serpula lacrymans var. lacrymans S7.3]|uniref:Uncharacterized protein n=2 Tax=Serpula lacrymans var. lacrymans TaxID=341189 RepID=F8PFY2_SERL3|nr:uncharacterized protein SERLADRAFT_432211 [Serpula lacrymans var. lacrymans S7.9]EGO04794.1 hypothetical protein SERLA73DRAFT_68459 [Serpula lacrymans var. lacrymans S7.3]EGO30628.1 hypothetical protein SERLADRAFT_432211 [Serpula lacrymans var. lacrymans S7.9]